MNKQVISKTKYANGAAVEAALDSGKYSKTKIDGVTTEVETEVQTQRSVTGENYLINFQQNKSVGDTYTGATWGSASSGNYCYGLNVTAGEKYHIYGYSNSSSNGIYCYYNNSKIIKAIKYGNVGSTLPEVVTITEDGVLFVNFIKSIPYDGVWKLCKVTEEGEVGIIGKVTDLNNRLSSIEGRGYLPFKKSNTNTFVGEGAGTNTEEQRTGSTQAEQDNGCYNTALGVGAFAANTTGDHSTAVGYKALHKNISGDHNTALGEDSMYENTTGGLNVAIGQHSIQNNNGSYNVAIGSNVGRTLGYGIDGRNGGALNTIIGAEACNNDNNTKTNNSVIVGAYAKANNCDDVIVIGKGTEALANGDVLIGTANSQRLLVKIGGVIRKINLNDDGSVTWETITT